MNLREAGGVLTFAADQAMRGQELQINSDMLSNTLLLRGTIELVERAARMIEVLDQPLPRGRNGAIIGPGFLAAADMAEDLAAVLRAEGHSRQTAACGVWDIAWGRPPRGTRAGPRNLPMAAVEASRRRTGPGRERRARWRGSYGPGPRASASNTSSSVRASSTFSAQASRSAAAA